MFFGGEVLPYAPDAWIAVDVTEIGYGTSFSSCLYKPPPQGRLEQIHADVLNLEEKEEGLLHKVVGDV